MNPNSTAIGRENISSTDKCPKSVQAKNKTVFPAGNNYLSVKLKPVKKYSYKGQFEKVPKKMAKHGGNMVL